MKKLTLLEIVQDVLNDMDGDEVNSINDTLESSQVAAIVASTYGHIIDGRDWPHLYNVYQLNSSTNVSLPTIMTVPEDVVEVLWIKYDKKKLGDTLSRYEEVKYKTPEDFLNYCNVRKSSDSNILTMGDIPLFIFTDRAPTYWTSFDDEQIVFDSFDSDVDTTLQNDKTQCYGKRLPTFSLADDFVPDLPAQAFSLLLSESKKHAAVSLKQMADPIATEYSITQRRRMSQEAWRTAGGVTFPSYGRK